MKKQLALLLGPLVISSGPFLTLALFIASATSMSYGASWDWAAGRTGGNESVLPDKNKPSLFLIGLPCKWEDLTKKEQAKAHKIGYKEGDTIWKTSDSSGTFKIPSGKVKIRSQKIDGHFEVILDTTGLFELAKPKSVGKGPLLRITHILVTGMTQEFTFRCLQKWEILSDADRQTALAKGYREGEEVIVYSDRNTKRFEIKTPWRE